MTDRDNGRCRVTDLADYLLEAVEPFSQGVPFGIHLPGLRRGSGVPPAHGVDRVILRAMVLLRDRISSIKGTGKSPQRTSSREAGAREEPAATESNVQVAALKQFLRRIGCTDISDRLYGEAIDNLEGFARTFLLAAFRIVGEGGRGVGHLIDFYSAGLVAGTDPSNPGRWPRLTQHPQAKVEAATLALALDMARPWLWDSLPDEAKAAVIDYFSDSVGGTYVQNNWVWFRLITQTFLRSVGGPHSISEMRADLAAHDTFVRSGGWIADGDRRAFDHYNGWALHFYPLLWAQMSGAQDLAAPRADADQARLAAYIDDALHLIGSDGNGVVGAPLAQGRSLTYRFACAAPFWVSALAGAPITSLGQARRAACAIIEHFVNNGAPDAAGLLPLGWFGEWPAIAQSYSGAGSPYWASKGLLGVALAPSHEIWSAAEEPLPIETSDFLRYIEAPNWIVSGTLRDGIVRVVNHGTDNANEGDAVGDAPLYGRLGYSTATFPWIDQRSLESPPDNTIGLVDVRGRVTHRSGWKSLGGRVDHPTDGIAVGVVASKARVRWVDRLVRTVYGATPDGNFGTFTEAGEITMISLVRGAWEVRLARVDSMTPGARLAAPRLRFSGWPVVEGDGLRSLVLPIKLATERELESGSESRSGDDFSPLGTSGSAPFVNVDTVVGQWSSVLVILDRERFDAEAPSASVAVVDDSAVRVTVTVVWPDGQSTTSAVGLVA